MSVKERLRQLVEELPENEAEELYEGLLAKRNASGEAPPLTGLAALDAALDEMAHNAPEEELARFPADFSEQLDHYIYGTKKR